MLSLKKKLSFLSGSSSPAPTVPHPGETFLLENARMYGDFEDIEQDYAEVLSANITDLSGNGHDFVPVNSVAVSTEGSLSGQNVSDLKSVKGVLSTAALVANWKCLKDAGNASDLFHTSFEVFIKVHSTDPIKTNASEFYFGMDAGSNNVIRLYTPTNGRVNFQIGNNTNGLAHYLINQATYVIPDEATGNLNIRVRVDYELNEVKFWINGAPEPEAVVTNISIINPANMNLGTGKIGIGWATNGTDPIAGSIVTEKTVLKFAVTPLLTDEQATNVMGLFAGENATIPAKSLRCFGDNMTLSCVKSGSVLDMGFALSEAPTSDVTVNISSQLSRFTLSAASLTFTTLNWATAQKVRFTAVADGVTNGITFDNLVCSFSGGGYSGTQNIYMRIHDSGIPASFVRGFNWLRNLHVQEESDIATYRSMLIARVFNGNGLPALTPTISTGFTGVMHGDVDTANLVGSSSVDMYTWVKNDIDGNAWTHKTYLIHNSSSNGQLALALKGHQGGTNTEACINAILAEGYNIKYCSMPVVGDNVTANATIAGLGTTGHNQILTGGLGSDARVPYYDPRELYLFDKTSAITLLAGTYGGTVKGFGISGGDWTITLLAAMMPEISIAVGVRGTKDKIYKRTGDDSGAVDYEQGGTWENTTNCGVEMSATYNTITYFDMFALATSGGRKYYKSTHYIDDSGYFRGFTYNDYKAKLNHIASQWDGVYDGEVDNDALTDAHAYSQFDIDNIVAWL